MTLGNSISPEIRPYHSLRMAELTVEGGCVPWGSPVIIKALQNTLLQDLHREHMGISKIKSLSRGAYMVART